MEERMLKEFIKIARKYGYEKHKCKSINQENRNYFFTGQCKHNQLMLTEHSYFQFGDLRIDMPSYHVIIEVETAGNVTNLAKYWYCFKEKLISKPIVLLHIFNTSSENDYSSHILLWDYLWSRMNNDLKLAG